ncbi:MAG TPA: CocE/NonD family hydrolase [Candidatus Thermoplasmatota archaeon]|nr:CocE/NonD family hydrolase [Candidatus Thermoplasmatota archaeon]
MRASALAVAAVLAFSGCLAASENALTPNAAGGPLTPVTTVQERASLAFETEGDWSQVLEPGAFGILDPLSVYVAFDVPATAGLPMQETHMGVFLPAIPGCDWEAESLADPCKVPVVADVGPYYGDLDDEALTPAHRLGKFLIDNLVPHGYAVAQVSVPGTGRSGGCMDLMGEIEQAATQAAVEWLGTQPWSNGNVGLIGRSYDGSTPWEAAMAPGEHLKTIVPISGLTGLYELMWRNGTAESRGPGLLWGIYYTFTYSPGEGQGPGVPLVGQPLPSPSYAPMHAHHLAVNAACPDTQTGLAHGVQAWATGAPGPDGYWQERNFRPAVLENYRGSVYLVQGLQDWNVDPHSPIPWYTELAAQGVETKALLGQWAHNYPDRLEEHESCDGSDLCHAPESVRMDWAQDLLEWFDHYLKGTGAKPALQVEVQDYNGRWRVEEEWPPRDATWVELALDEALALTSDGPRIVGPLTDRAIPVLVFESEALAADTRIAGLPQFHVTTVPHAAGGQVFAELRDATDDRRIGTATMDLRFAAGGNEAKPVVPGQSLVALMEFEPLDALVPAGHVLELRVSYTGRDYLPSPVGGPVEIGAGVLRLPTIERGEETFFVPPTP